MLSAIVCFCQQVVPDTIFRTTLVMSTMPAMAVGFEIHIACSLVNWSFKNFRKGIWEKIINDVMSNAPINVMSCYLAPSWADLWEYYACMRLDSSPDPTLSRGETVW